MDEAFRALLEFAQEQYEGEYGTGRPINDVPYDEWPEPIRAAMDALKQG